MEGIDAETAGPLELDARRCSVIRRREKVTRDVMIGQLCTLKKVFVGNKPEDRSSLLKNISNHLKEACWEPEGALHVPSLHL